MKKAVGFSILSLLILCFLFACSKAGAEDTKIAEKPVEISLLSNMLGGTDSALESAVIDFEKESGIQVDFSSPGKNYENIMKENMATGKMPDVFTTHGWSVNRYQNYLLPLNDLSFAKNISGYIRPIITDSTGALLVLPIDMDLSGIVYDPGILKKAGITPNGIATWDDFAKACEKIRRAGYNPICIAGKDANSAGQFVDRVSSSFFITNEAANQRAELRSGKFNVATWKKAAEMMSLWGRQGYYNSDILNCDYSGLIKEIAQGKSAFIFLDNSVIFDVKRFNPKSQLSMMPIPAEQHTDSPTMVVGESMALGIWKASAHKEAAQKLLEYLAQPAVAEKIASSNGKPSALTNVKNSPEVSPCYFKNKPVRTFPYFDREYLPTGMWDVLCSVGTDILSNKPDAVNQSAVTMQNNFRDKFFFNKS